MVPAAPLLPTMLPARPAVVHGDTPDVVVGGEVELVDGLEDVLTDDPLVDEGDPVVVGDDDVDEHAPRTTPQHKPPATKAFRHVLIPMDSLSSSAPVGG